jgi:hypothetical protein
MIISRKIQLPIVRAAAFGSLRYISRLIRERSFIQKVYSEDVHGSSAGLISGLGTVMGANAAQLPGARCLQFKTSGIEFIMERFIIWNPNPNI